MANRLFFTFNHQGKADSYIRALVARGWIQTNNPDRTRFVLSDMDIGPRGRTLRFLREQGIRVFLYPHGGIPSLFWDFPGYEYSHQVEALFVPARGHVEVMRAYGVPYPLEVVGWSLSGIAPFQVKPDVRKVVFAPIHPNSNGFLCALDRRINRETFSLLLKLSQICYFDLTVRYLGDLDKNGIWKAGGVEYIKGKPDLSIQEIDRADLVVAHHTFAYLAVARGIPTLMMGEDIPPRVGGKEDALKSVKSWEKYKDLLKYPLDILEGDPIQQIERATCSDEPIREWRERMIGEPFDPGRFVDTLERYL